MKRLIDIIFSIIFILIFFPLFLVFFLLIFLQGNNPIFLSKRVGKKSKIFSMPKFKSMNSGTPIIASEFINKKKIKYLYFGKFIRETKLDELPQLFSVLFGQMSLVGPRPLLYNQKKLIQIRKKKKIDELLPGITGYAQINDFSAHFKNKIKYDLYYKKNICLKLDLIIVYKSIVFVSKRILHLYFKKT